MEKNIESEMEDGAIIGKYYLPWALKPANITNFGLFGSRGFA